MTSRHFPNGESFDVAEEFVDERRELNLNSEFRGEKECPECAPDPNYVFHAPSYETPKPDNDQLIQDGLNSLFNALKF